MSKNRRSSRLAATLLRVSLSAAVAPWYSALASEATVESGRQIAAHGVSPERPGCASCHLQDGAGQPDVGIPRLAGLTSSYILTQLNYFAAGSRHDIAMAPYAVMLTTAQREEVADYFASLPVPLARDQMESAPSLLAHGRSLFLNGEYRSGVLSCSQCHGADGAGVGTFSPRLAGQSAVYISDELNQWHAGHIRDPEGVFMQAEAKNLTSSDIAAVAAYVSSLGEKDQTP